MGILIKNGLISSLGQNNILYSTIIAEKLGVDCAIVLGSLVSFVGDKKNVGITYEEIKEDISLSIYRIAKAIKVLSIYEIVLITKNGKSNKNHYTLNAKQLKIMLGSGKNE